MTTPFKSDRAAKLAYRRTERAYEAAREQVIEHKQAARETGWSEEAFAKDAALRAAADAAFAQMDAVYHKVIAEGHWVSSWHCGPNATRDLIAQNID